MASIIFEFKGGAVIESAFDELYTNDLLDEILRLKGEEEIIKIAQTDGKTKKIRSIILN
ncbi:hypothetical protein [Paenibacillus sp. FSL L8-0506]